MSSLSYLPRLASFSPRLTTVVTTARRTLERLLPCRVSAAIERRWCSGPAAGRFVLVAAAALVVPGASRGDPRALAAPQQLEVSGVPPVYFYPPLGRSEQKPVVLYLHGRGGNPMQDCMKWARVARDYGWLVCPSGPEDRGGGSRAWNNDWMTAKAIVDKALAELRQKEGRRVQTRGNTLIGFSEGAFVGMNIGVRDPQVWNRWLILAASDLYWGGEGQSELDKNALRVKRVYLMTGKLDGVAGATERVFHLLDEAGVHVMMRTPEDLGHEIPEARMRQLYVRPLQWLNR